MQSCRDYPQHQGAKAWWDEVLSGAQTVSLSHAVLLGFIRITTPPRVIDTPLTLEQASGVADGWLRQPNLRLDSPGEAHGDCLKSMLRAGHAGGDLVTAAHLTALVPPSDRTVAGVHVFCLRSGAD